MSCSPPGSSVHGILQANTGVGFCVLLQGIFLTQGLNSHLLYPSIGSEFFIPSPHQEAPLFMPTETPTQKSCDFHLLSSSLNVHQFYYSLGN